MDENGSWIYFHYQHAIIVIEGHKIAFSDGKLILEKKYLDSLVNMHLYYWDMYDHFMHRHILLYGIRIPDDMYIATMSGCENGDW